MRIFPTFWHTCLLCLAIVFHLHGQDYSWKNYSVADGLPQTQVTYLTQDSRGLIWIGTKNGFSIFDGIEFENFSTKDGLDFDHINTIQEIDRDTHYIGTTGGLNVMEKGEIRVIGKNIQGKAYFIHCDSEGNLWYSHSQYGYCIYDSGRFSTDYPVFSLMEPGEQLNLICVQKKDKKLAFTSKAGNVFLPGPSGYRKIHIGGEILSLLEGEDANIYVANEHGLFRMENEGFTMVFGFQSPYHVLYVTNSRDFYLVDIGFQPNLYHCRDGRIVRIGGGMNLITVVLVDDEKNLWVASDAGLWRLQSKGLQNYFSEPDKRDYVWSVLQDKNGDYIFGSYNSRLSKLSNGHLSEIPIHGLYKNQLPFYSGCIKTRDGDLLMTTTKGVARYDGHRLEWFFQPEPRTTVVYIYDDRKYNKYLLACSSMGLVEIDESKNVKVYEGREPQEHTELITSILRDKYDRIWISGEKGVSIWNNSQWHQLPDQTDSVPVGAISMIMDSEQNIWLGGTDGLYFYDYKKLQKIAPGILNTQIGVLNLTDDEKLLIGSIGLLALVDLAEFYNTGKATVRTYDHNSGFNGGECKHNSSFKDNEGNIWICTSNGVVKVNPKDLVPNPYTPRIYTRAATSNNETIMLENTPTDTIISLNPEKRNLRFNYRAISHAAPHLVRYRTQLTGYDSDWSGETSERYRSYTNLPQGQYTFMVTARNGDGVWAAEPASVSFRILPAWYEKLWVKIAGILGAMAFTAVIGYLYSERKRRIKQKEEVAERNMAKLQFRSLKGMIDPHFTFNALNSIASMVYQGNRDEAYGYFTKFSRLIRNVFEHAEHTTRTLEEELEFVTNYLDIEKMRFGDKFSYTIHCEAGIDKFMEIPKLLIQIYVENALKHGLMWLDTGGLLEVNILNRARGVEIAIRDNGPGRSQAKQTGRQSDGLGKGTMILHEYFHLLNRFNDKKLEAETIDLFNDQGAAAGTEVRIILPYDFKYSL